MFLVAVSILQNTYQAKYKSYSLQAWCSLYGFRNLWIVLLRFVRLKTAIEWPFKK